MSEETSEKQLPFEKLESRSESVSIKCSFDSFEKAQKELNKPLKVWAIASIGIGAVALAAYIAIGTIFEKESVFNNVLLFAGAILLVIGIMLVALLKQRLKTAVENNRLKNEYEFFFDSFIVQSDKMGDKLGMSKVYYSSVGKVKETKEYLFIYLSDKRTAFAVEKSRLSHLEFDTLMRLMSKNPKFGGKTIELSQCGKAE